MPALPNAFVIGDAAHIVADGRTVPGVAPATQEQGAYVATLIRAGSAVTPCAAASPIAISATSRPLGAARR